VTWNEEQQFWERLVAGGWCLLKVLAWGLLLAVAVAGVWLLPGLRP
jgi:hypothetical protein